MNTPADQPAPQDIAPVDPPRQFDEPQLGLALTEVDRLIRAPGAEVGFAMALTSRSTPDPDGYRREGVVTPSGSRRARSAPVSK